MSVAPRAPDLASQRERPTELDANDRPRLGVPARLQHHAQDAVDAEPGVRQRRPSVSFISPSARAGAVSVNRK